jgi:SAM-dependent methyltransferase
VHAARYLFAMPYVKGRRTLDIACGTGYGLGLLSSEVNYIVGVDLDLSAASKAKSEIEDKRGAVIVADGCHLPFPDGAFDVITTFETIEHLEKRTEFLAELKRVLSPEGLCILSTPNANHTEPVNGKPINPHHVYEYQPQELREELEQHFADVRLLGQVLDSRFRIPPFIDEQEKLTREGRMRGHILLWRVLNKLPFKGRDHLSRALWGQPFRPAETDYRFKEEVLETAPVLVALCRNSQPD